MCKCFQISKFLWFLVVLFIPDFDHLPNKVFSTCVTVWLILKILSYHLAVGLQVLQFDNFNDHLTDYYLFQTLKSCLIQLL